MFLRENSYDAEIVKEIKPAYGWLDVKGKVVLDIGACFGAATVHFLEMGAKQVIAVEPDKDNYRQLERNTKKYNNVVLIHAAVSTYTGDADLYLTPGINKGIHSLHVTRGRKKVTVPTESFKELVRRFRPSVLKIDCEGAEYDFLTYELPSFVKQVAMEIHFGKKRWREEDAPRMVSLFDDWEVVKEPQMGGRNWHTLGGWRR